MSILDETVFMSAGEITQIAEEKKLAKVRLVHYPKIGITTATIELRNGSAAFKVKLSKRNRTEKTKEKLFKSIDGATRWAFNLISKSVYEGTGCSYEMSIYTTDQITIDGVHYSKHNIFNWDEHHKI